MEERNNSFDVIRHFAAFLVLFSHQFRLSGFEEPLIKGWDTLGFIGVAIFFTISGYFMPKSFESSGSFFVFIEKRCRRIFPGLFACSFIMVYVIGLFFTNDNKTDYILSYANIKDVFLHTIFIHNVTPGLFSDFIVKDAINGSLWTLPIEFLCYIIIGSALSLAFNWKTAMILLWLASLATATINLVWTDFSFYGISMKYLAIFGIPFATGALMSLTKKSWSGHKVQLSILAIFLMWLLRGRWEIFVLGTASLSILVVIVGVSFREKLINGKFDISYGMYIYAFPIQQIIINRVTNNLWLSMLLSISLTIIIAFLSFKYIESPFLIKNKKSVKKNNNQDYIVNSKV